MRRSLVLKTVLSVICAWTANAVAQEPVSSQPLVMNGSRVATTKATETAGKSVQRTVVRQPVNQVVDCTLKGDSLVGRMRSVSGQAVINTRLQLLNKRGEVRVASTDARGNFVFEKVPTGLYALHAAGSQAQFVRAWTATLAPPSSKQQLLVVQKGHVVRGQQCCNDPAAVGCSSCGECADCCDGGCGGLGLGGSPRVGIGRMAQVALDNPWFVAAGTAAAIAIPLATTDDDERIGDTTDAVANGEDAS